MVRVQYSVNTLELKETAHTIFFLGGGGDLLICCTDHSVNLPLMNTQHLPL